MNGHRFIWGFLLVCSAIYGAAPLKAAPTWTPVGINSFGNPRGYWEFLPTAYPLNPTQNFPLVIYLHGLGEGGAGTVGTELNEVLVNQVAKNLNTPSDPIRALLDQNNVIVLCPQTTNNTWWVSGSVRPFIDYAIAHYRVDPTRIYLTGLSSGSAGTQSFMSLDPNADQVTAFLVCAYRGDVAAGSPAELVKVCPFWALTSKGDWSSKPDVTCNLLAGTLQGTAPTDCMANYPGGNSPTVVYTGKFSPATPWTWSAGVDPSDGVNPKLTVFTGSDHNSWARTYNDVNTWTWLLAQKKPNVAITSPASGTVVVPGGALSLAASAQDKDGVALTGANVQWSSNLDGLLGVGANLTVSNLSIGSHVITCQAVDNKYRGRRTQITVTVPYAGAFTTRFDFGSPAAGFLTTDPGWNNITSPLVGNAGSIVNNAVDINGNPIGLRAEITQRFDNFNTNGATSSVLYPVTAQNDTMYVSATYPVGQVLLSGLNPAQTYNFTFYASRTSSGNRTSVYTINGVSTSLNASDNTTQTASLLNLVPNSAGQLTLTLSIGSGATFGYLGVMTITTTGPSQTPLQAWRTLHSLAANGSQDLLTPAGDGVPNLLKFAFNLAPSSGDLPLPQNRIMTATGTSGLPLVQTDGSNHLTATFLRRKASTNSGTTYIPEFTEDLAGTWTTLTTTPTITSVDSTWERVTYTDSAVISAATKRFLRVRVTTP